MKRIFISGCDLEGRRTIENFLDDSFVVVGYTDTDLKRQVDGLEGEPAYVHLDMIKDHLQEFDYIIPTFFDEKRFEACKKILMEHGVDEEKILYPCILQPGSNEKLHENMVETVRQAKDEYYGLIFGMSYSRKGIDRRKLRNRWFDFSCDGMDLYYNMKLLKYAVMTGKFKSAEEAWLVAPNYYMQYDQSMSITQYRSGQMFCASELNDFHNFQKIGGICRLSKTTS